MSICSSIILIFLLSPYSESKSNYGVNNSTNIAYEFCQPTTCGRKGPVIRFPFRLNTQPVFCGLEGFELSCSSNNNTVLHLPSFNSSTNDFYVQEISYLDSIIAITDPNETTCPVKTLFSLNLTSFESPFLKIAYDNWEFTTVNCTEKIVQSSRLYRAAVGPIDCISDDKNFVYVISAFTEKNWPMDVLPPNCRILSRSKWIPGHKNIVKMAWEALGGCHRCEKSGNFCGFNITNSSTICVENEGNIISFYLN
ncbi:hypothetical protein EZV62_008528 [Acer yangbiense]|uniref:RING-type E3 ubiquitin transferase n=1 Tax=Acer yangbiense TaxID=1000413 RepID=A0A5C7ID46_9ROSI|nr:hypothetical protein EZV62_008528 [Acer yangbiense]